MENINCYLPDIIIVCICVLSSPARSQDNTWPEELMAVMKEVEQQELDREKLRDRNLKTQGCDIHVHVECKCTRRSSRREFSNHMYMYMYIYLYM